MEQYRSGHNGHDWKSCVPQKGTEGSNPSCSARKKNLMHLHRVLFCCGIKQRDLNNQKRTSGGHSLADGLTAATP